MDPEPQEQILQAISGYGLLFEDLRAKTDLPRTVFKKHLHKLVNDGFITCYRRSARSPNIYYLTEDIPSEPAPRIPYFKNLKSIISRILSNGPLSLTETKQELMRLGINYKEAGKILDKLKNDGLITYQTHKSPETNHKVVLIALNPNKHYIKL